MTILQLFAKKLREMKENRENAMQPQDGILDPHLRSLRRQRQRQLEELEKERLKLQINEYNKAKVREYVGFRQNEIKKKIEKKKDSYFKEGQGGFLKS